MDFSNVLWLLVFIIILGIAIYIIKKIIYPTVKPVINKIFNHEGLDNVDEETDDFDDFINESLDIPDVDDEEDVKDEDVSVSYTAGYRDGNGEDPKLLKSIEENTKKMMDKQNELGVVVTNPEHASFTGGNIKYTREQLMDSSLLLPGQVSEKLKKDFNLPPEAVKMDNKNLITVNKSIGVNTVGSSLRNPTHDIRGDVLVNMSYQGPWNMSTIEPDVNNIGLCNN